MPRVLVLIAAVAMALPRVLQGAQTILLEIRVFNGPEEVTNQTRVFVHRAGDRGEPHAQAGGGPARIELNVPEGIYDVQAIHERDGQVVSIQWANRLVVMKYPDEGGRHLEVLNFKSGFGALQIRRSDGSQPEVALFATGPPAREVTPASGGPGYALFVVPAGTYDVATRGERPVRHPGIDVPRDRTRLWLVPDDK